MARIILTNSLLIDGFGSSRAGQSIAIEGDRVADIWPSDAAIAMGPDDEVHDLAGKVVMPGMISGHFHASYHDIGRAPGLPGIESPPAFAAYQALANAKLALASGFTSVVGAGSIYDIDASLARAVEQGLVCGPRVVPSSRLIFSGDDGGLYPWWVRIGDFGPAKCDGVEGMRAMVRSEMNRGARMIKLSVGAGHGTPGTPDECHFSYEEILAAVETAHDRGIPVRAHVTGKQSIMRCVRAGVDILDHADWLDDECIEAIIKADCFVLPSALFTYRTIQLNEPPFYPDHPAYENMKEQLPRAAAAGMKLCIGDDFGLANLPHGEYAQEMTLYVEEFGISPLEVIKWATINPAGMVGLGDALGGIQSGRLADLIIVNGNPADDIMVLENHSNIQRAMIGGKFVDENDLL